MSASYAIVESGGKQYRVEKGQRLLVDRLPDEEGAKVSLRPVLYRGEDAVLDPGELEKVKVEAVVAEHLRGPKIRVFKYKPKKGYRRRAGHRAELTKLEITDIRMLTRKPARKKAEGSKERAGDAKPKAKAAPKRTAAKTSGRKSSTARKKQADGS